MVLYTFIIFEFLNWFEETRSINYARFYHFDSIGDKNILRKYSGYFLINHNKKVSQKVHIFK